MIIDAHNHPDWHKHDLQRFLQNMAQHNIDKTWLLSWEAPADEWDPIYYSTCHTGPEGPIPFAHCLRYAQQAPGRFVLGYAPDPRRPNAIDLLQAAIDIHSVRVYGELKLRMTYDNPDALRMFRFCGEHGLPVTVHIDYAFDTGRAYPRPNWWYGGGIEAFARAVRACPETIFIGHAPGFWAHISGDDQYDQVAYPKGKVVPGGRVVELLRQSPNLYADLSAGSGLNALQRDPAFAVDFVLEFQDRLLYARDYFDNRLQQFLSSLDLPADVSSKLYSENALKLVPA
jgi:predicted TIM-barrel fold metal-dependent hydrolase